MKEQTGDVLTFDEKKKVIRSGRSSKKKEILP